MSSGAPKMVEMSYGVAGSGRKITNFLVVHGGRAAALPARCCAPPRPARFAGGRPVVPRLVRSLTARK